MFDQFKSKGVESYLKKEFARYFKDGGKDLYVDLRTADKSCSISATLAGDNTTTTVEIEKYEVVEDGDDRLLKIVDISCNREWANLTMSDFLKGRSFPIPLFVAAAL